MIEDDLRQILGDLIPDLNKITIDYLTRSGIKSGSNLAKSSTFVETENGLALEANYYFTYRSEGRKRGVKKVPIRALIDYIKRYGIVPRAGQSINQLAFAIQTAIYKRGIQPLGYLERIMEASADVTEEVVADELIEDIADEVVKAMTVSPYATETT